MKRNNKAFIGAAWIAIVVAILAGLAMLYIGVEGSSSVKGVQANVYGQMRTSLGDMLAGTVGVCLSFAATLFMVVTFNEQRAQHEEQLRQQTRERFENTFFNMLSMMFDVRATVDSHIRRDTNGKMKSIQDYYNGLKHHYATHKGDETVKRIERMLASADPCDAELEQAEECLGELFAAYVSATKCSIGYYYRYIHNLINFVLRQWNGDANSAVRKQYLNMVQAQMSDEELGLVFYDAISMHGLNKRLVKEFKTNLDTEGFLENINASSLLNRNHHKLYPSTVFKFLNIEEKNAKRIK